MIQITKGSFCSFLLLLLFAIRNSRFLISSSSRSPVRGKGAEKRDRAGLERRRQERLHFPRKFLSGKHDSGESPATARRRGERHFLRSKNTFEGKRKFQSPFSGPVFSQRGVRALLCMGHRQTERHFFSSFLVAPPPRDDDSCIPP